MERSSPPANATWPTSCAKTKPSRASTATSRRRPARRSSTPKANTSSPASSTRTSTFICRSWARSPRTPTRPAARRRWSAARRPYRDVLPGAQGRCARGVSNSGWARRGASAPAISPSTWAWRGSTTRREKQLARDRQARHQQLQDLPRLQRRVRPRRRGALPHAPAGQEARRHHHRALRERGRSSPSAAEGTARRRQDRPGMASREPAAAGRGRRRPSPDDVRRAPRRARLYRPHELRGSPATRPSPRDSAACKVWVETLIQYLHARQDLRRAPELRGRQVRHVAAAARQAQSGQSCGTACATASSAPWPPTTRPFDFATQKRMGEKDFTKIPNGIPSLEDRVNAALHLWREDAAGSTCTVRRTPPARRPRRLFGLFPRKGTIQPGSDADLVVYDPNYRGTISVKTQNMNVDYNPFEGWRSKAARASSPSAARSPCATASSSAKPAAENSSSASRAIS